MEKRAVIEPDRTPLQPDDVRPEAARPVPAGADGHIPTPAKTASAPNDPFNGDITKRASEAVERR